ncbi:MAG: SCO family protein [Candidatus Binatia bacterium]
MSQLKTITGLEKFKAKSRFFSLIFLAYYGFFVCLTPYAFALPGASVYSSQRPEPGTPASYNPFTDVGYDQRLDAQVPLDLTFVDEAGKTVSLRSYFDGKPTILVLAYYDCPMLCTLVLNGLVKALRTLSLSVGTDFNVLTVSFDSREKPELAAEKKQIYLKAYNRPGAEQSWRFLTGTEDAIRQLTQTVGFRYEYDQKSNQFAHASGIMILTPQGKISKYFYGIEYSARDVRLGLVEASEGKIGSLIDQVLLLCFHYDPAGAKYSLLIFRIVQVTGLGVLLLLGAYIFFQVRREKKQRKKGEVSQSHSREEVEKEINV